MQGKKFTRKLFRTACHIAYVDAHCALAVPYLNYWILVGPLKQVNNRPPGSKDNKTLRTKSTKLVPRQAVAHIPTARSVFLSPGIRMVRDRKLQKSNVAPIVVVPIDMKEDNHRVQLEANSANDVTSRMILPDVVAQEIQHHKESTR